MDEMVKQFTLIDYLGILVPGCILTLACSAAWPDLMSPVTSSFGDNVIALFLYVLIIGYVLGNALEQLGAMAEDMLWGKKFWKRIILPETYFQGAEMRKAYTACFPDRTYPSNLEEESDASGDIFRYVQKEKRTQRILIFSAFYTMSRTLVITLLPVIILLPKIVEADHFVVSALSLGILIVLFCFRWIRFERKGLIEARMLLLSMAEKKSGGGTGL